MTQSRVNKLLELKSSYGLRYSIHSPYSDINLAAPDPMIRNAVLKRLEETIKWASSLEAEALVVHPGSTTYQEQATPGIAWRLNFNSIKQLCNRARDFGVPLMIENLPRAQPCVMSSVEAFERFYGEGLDVKMVLDVAHANLGGETGSFLERLGDKISHIHVSDNHGQLDEHLQLGEGLIDWEKTIKDIKKASYHGWIVIESLKAIDESLSLLKGLVNV